MRILPKEEKPDYENIKNRLEKLIHSRLEEVEHDIMMEQLYDWLEYTCKLENENQWLYGKLNIISDTIEESRKEVSKF